MGDRTWVTITVAQNDIATLLTTMGFTMADKDNLNADEHDGLLDIIPNEMNYGAYDELQALAVAGVTFTAHNGSGCNYGEGLSVGYKGIMIDVDALNNEPVCVIGKNMEPNTESIKNIRRYYALLKKAEDEFGKIKYQVPNQPATVK